MKLKLFLIIFSFCVVEYVHGQYYWGRQFRQSARSLQDYFRKRRAESIQPAEEEPVVEEQYVEGSPNPAEDVQLDTTPSEESQENSAINAALKELENAVQSRVDGTIMHTLAKHINKKNPESFASNMDQLLELGEKDVFVSYAKEYLDVFAKISAQLSAYVENPTLIDAKKYEDELDREVNPQEYQQQQYACPVQKPAEMPTTSLPALNPRASYYDLLEVARDADKSQIKKAYAEKRKLYEAAERTDEVQLLTNAFNTLKNPELRAAYDRGGETAVETEQFAQTQESQLTGNIDTILGKLEDAWKTEAHGIFIHTLAEQLKNDVPGSFVNSMWLLFMSGKMDNFKAYVEWFGRIITQAEPKYAKNPTVALAIQHENEFKNMASDPQRYLYSMQEQQRQAQAAQQYYQQVHAQQMMQQEVINFRQNMDRLIAQNKYIINSDDPQLVTGQQTLLDQALMKAQSWFPLYSYVMQLYMFKAQLYFEYMFWHNLQQVIQAAENSHRNLVYIAQGLNYSFATSNTEAILKRLKSYKKSAARIQQINEFTEKVKKASKLTDIEKLEDKADEFVEDSAKNVLLFDMKGVRLPSRFNKASLAQQPVTYLLDITNKLVSAASKETRKWKKKSYNKLAAKVLRLAERIAEKVNNNDFRKIVEENLKTIEKGE